MEPHVEIEVWSWHLGFKDLHMFNMSLLAKHSWKLMIDSALMIYKIYKTKYFPTTNFLEAKLGPSPSKICRGICKARDILLEGCRLKVGNDQSIDIWRDY